MSNTQPPTINLRWGQMEEWLRENGISQYKLRLLVGRGVIKPHKLAGGRYYYNAAEIQRDVLDELNGDARKVFNLKGDDTC